MMFVSYLIFTLLISFTYSEVIQLDQSNFEHLTQASTGATTGDWLVKFYAPWCGHCKKMEGLYEEVADILDGEINVARVDVPANRDLGKRFDIKGFPTIKFLSKGKVYTYEGRRTAVDLIEFARNGYQIHEPEDVQSPVSGLWGDLKLVFKHAYKTAATDLKEGRYFTLDILLVFMPFLFLILVLLIVCTPLPQVPKKRPIEERNDESKTFNKMAAPPTSETDTPISRTFGKKED